MSDLDSVLALTRRLLAAGPAKRALLERLLGDGDEPDDDPPAPTSEQRRGAT